MKTIQLCVCLCLLLLCSFCASAKNYYVSAAGNDANDGLTIATSWRTIAKVNSAALSSGDVILFHRGDAFAGGITVSQNNISFDAYGTGVLPIVTGLATLTAWTSMGNGIWKCSVPAAGTALKIVAINGQLQRMGRWPNYNSTDGGWLTYESLNGATPSITDNQLGGLSANNWTGAEAVIKKYSYIIDVNPITAQSGNTLSYSFANDLYGTTGSTGTPGYGYFIQNDLRTLDVFGEWFLNKTTKDLYVYFGSNNPASYNVQAAVQEILFDAGGGGYMGAPASTARTGIAVNSIDFEGANTVAFNSSNGANISFTNCIVNNCRNGVFMWNVPNSLTGGNTVTNILNNAIQIHGQVSSPTVISNNTIKNTGLFEGLGGSGAGANIAIMQDGNNATITGNTIDSTAYHGIWFQGSNITVQHNYIKDYCAILDDGGGIYTFQDTTKTNRVVDGNIIVNGIGGKLGRTGTNAMTWGIYTDGESRNIIISNNTVSLADAGGYVMNTGQNITLRGNTFYNLPVAITVNRFGGDFDLDRNNRFVSNIIFPTVNNILYTQNGLNYPAAQTIQSDMQSVGVWDSSYYRSDLVAPWYYYYSPINGSTYTNNIVTTLSGWRTFISGEAKSDTISRVNKVFVYNATNSPATYNFPALVKKDVSGNSYSSSVTIPAWSSKVLIDNGIALNVLPVVTMGGSQSITLPTSTTTISGSATDPDGTISVYNWSKIAGPANGTIATPAAATTVLTNLVQGVYKFKLTVADNSGGITMDSLQVTVNPATNQPPVANAGADQSIAMPVNSATLSGIGTDVDGTISTYTWTKISGPGSGTVVSPNTAITSLTGLVQGAYIFVLAVTDNSGATSRDSLQVTVNPALNQPPVANAGADQSINLPANSVTLSGSGTDVDGTIATYAWTKISGPTSSTVVSPNTATTSLTGLVQGAYIFVLAVTDNSGATSRDSLQVTVNPAPNQPPVANAGMDMAVTLPSSSATLSGTGTDATGTITSYKWVKISGPSAGKIRNASGASTLITSLVKGVYQYTLTVTDSKGLTGKDTVQVTVSSAAKKMVAANAGASKTVVLPATTVTLSGAATTENTTISNTSWVKIEGPANAVIVNPSNAVTTVENLSEGNYTYEFTVRDKEGNSASDTVSIKVEAPSDNTSLTVYPNPVRNTANLEIKTRATKEMTKVTVSVIGVTGKIAERKSYVISGSTNVLKLDLANIATGVYIIQAAFENGKTLSAPVIKLKTN